MDLSGNYGTLRILLSEHTKKTDIYLSVNNREEVLKLPVVPPEITISKPRINETFDTVNSGPLCLIGKNDLKKISWSSFFPNKDYPFLRNRDGKAADYIYQIDNWYNQLLPMRLIITNTDINIPCTISDFNYTLKPNGDYDYSIELCEVRLV